jgi:hypothetical protein
MRVKRARWGGECLRFFWFSRAAEGILATVAVPYLERHDVREFFHVAAFLIEKEGGKSG